MLGTHSFDRHDPPVRFLESFPHQLQIKHVVMHAAVVCIAERSSLEIPGSSGLRVPPEIVKGKNFGYMSPIILAV